MRVRWWLAATGCALLLSGCSDEERAATLAERAAEVSSSRVDHGPGPDPATDPLGARLHARVIERASLHEEVGEPLRGTLREGRIATHPLLLVGTWCYLILAEAAPSVEELDLVLIDEQGAPILRDDEQGHEASLGLTHPVCPYEPGMHRLQVKATRGEGEYVVRVFRARVL